MELKTHKKRGPCYTKEEFGQVTDHRRWAKEQYPSASDTECIFVGPILPACKGTTPADLFFVSKLIDFADIADIMIDTTRRLSTGSSPLDFLANASNALTTRNLFYENVLSAVPRHAIVSE